MRRTVLMVATMALTLLVASGVALAAVVTEAEPNNSIAGAQEIAATSFDLSANHPDLDIANSTTVPHATVNGGGDATVDGSANDTFDYYSFTVPAGDRKEVILDIDHTRPDDSLNAGGPQYNSWIELYGSSGTRLDFSDDLSGGLDPGSTTDDPNGYDSLIETTLAPGTYVVGVGQYENGQMGVIPDTATYQLHVSVSTSDTTPPLPVDVSPDPNQTNIATSADVTATFSEEVQGVTENTFKLERVVVNKRGGERFRAVRTQLTTVVNGGITTATLDPVKDLQSGVQYHVTITNAVTDTAGNPLGLTTWGFTTASSPPA